MKAAELRSRPIPGMRRAERILLLTGLVLLLFWGSARVYQSAASRAAIARFRAKVAGGPPQSLSSVVDSAVGSRVDFRFWSTNRITAYTESLTLKGDLPLAVLRIPAVNLQAPVFDGTEMAGAPDARGALNATHATVEREIVGIAGHSDGFFRALKDTRVDDVILLDLRGRTEQYVVKNIQIVNTEDTYVLAPAKTPTLTLVTCFPFYFVGNAPQRYILTASLKNSSQPD